MIFLNVLMWLTILLIVAVAVRTWFAGSRGPQAPARPAARPAARPEERLEHAQPPAAAVDTEPAVAASLDPGPAASTVPPSAARDPAPPADPAPAAPSTAPMAAAVDPGPAAATSPPSARSPSAPPPFAPPPSATPASAAEATVPAGTRTTTATTGGPMKPGILNYPIEDIEGIGPAYGQTLAEVGIDTTGRLLDRCDSARGRKEIADRTGLTERQLLKWVNMADLMRLSGVGEEWSELLEAAGVDTVKELQHRNADNLAAKMAEVNDDKNLARRVPSASQVANWVEQAKTLEPRITH